MDKMEFDAAVQAVKQAGKGLLAMDERNPTRDRRIAEPGIPQTVEARRGEYRLNMGKA